jgi:CDP-diacylglycerol--glycerol-3-phosphate 3-phosphatidyltransferase
MHVVSVLGKFLDPLADKLLVMAVLIYMIPMGRISTWAVALLLAREISVTGLRSIASSEGVVIAAGDDGKTKTALQMVGILCLILGYPYHLTLGPLDLGEVDLVYVGRALVYVSLVFSIMSALSYTRLFAEAVEAKNSRGTGDPR